MFRLLPRFVVIGLLLFSSSRIIFAQENASKHAIDEFAWNGPLFLGSKKLSDLKKMSGFIRENVKFERNLHFHKGKIEFRTLVYTGLVIYGDVKENEISPIKITVSGPQWKIAKDLSVGGSVDYLVKILGKPSKIKNNSYLYIGETERVEFIINNGKIKTVIFAYYAD